MGYFIEIKEFITKSGKSNKLRKEAFQTLAIAVIQL